MSGIAAVIEDGKVANMIVVPLEEDGTTDFHVEGLTIVVVPEDSPVTMGYGYDGANFTAPEVTE